MQAHFGTDGIRGRANENLTVDMAYRIGQYLGNYLQKGKILIGYDTRLSNGMFETALSAGITAMGANAYQLKTCSTPSLIYLVRTQGFDLGIMITASHNPYTDNGIKIISKDGLKIDAQLEKDIEAYIYSDDQLPAATGADIGKVIDYQQGLQIYLDYLAQEYPLDLSNYRLLIDCANGSNTVTAYKLLTSLKAKVDVINAAPNGLNINLNCGSTHIEGLIEKVKAGNYDGGFAFDGDADRVIAVAPDGAVVDGDKIIFCCGKYLADHDLLNGGKVVTTVMANLGLFKLLDKYGIGYEKTQVGDKYVYECMCKNGYVLGGEQSGHIIFSKHATTGDGLLTALELLNLMVKEGKSLNELTDELFVYPQLLVNVEVKDKEAVLQDEDVKAKCAEVEALLEGNGRVLVRPSGTEPLVRVMVEAETDELCKEYVYSIVDFIKSKGY